MTKGQSAMAAAMAMETNRSTQQAAAKEAGLSQTGIAKARTVLKWTPDLAPDVLAGIVPLDSAYAEAAERKTQAAIGHACAPSGAED